MALPPPAESSTALITGASSGIGAAIARALAGRGHGVTLVARREERLRELADELAGAHGIRAEAIGCDLGDPAARDALASEIEARELDVEILVNNAGFGGFGSFVKLGRERQLDMVRLNVEAIVDLMGRYLPAMKERGSGAVINIASVAAFQPLPDNATYAATKAFVLSLGEATHTELKGEGRHRDQRLSRAGSHGVHGRGEHERRRGGHPRLRVDDARGGREAGRGRGREWKARGGSGDAQPGDRARRPALAALPLASARQAGLAPRRPLGREALDVGLDEAAAARDDRDQLQRHRDQRHRDRREHADHRVDRERGDVARVARPQAAARARRWRSRRER